MPFLATWMNLEIKSDRGRQIAYGIAYIWKLKKNTNELIYKTGTNSQTQRMNLCEPEGKGGGGEQIGSLGLTPTSCYI